LVAEFPEANPDSAGSQYTSDLCELESQLPGVLASARAPSTNAIYAKAYERWKDWALAHKVSPLPADSHSLCLYLVYVGNTAASFSTVNLAYCGIIWAHSLTGLASPASNSVVTETLAGLKYRLARPKKPKEPFRLEHMHKLYAQVNFSDLTDLRNVCLKQIAFDGFFRFEEVTHIKIQNIKFHETHTEILVQRAKTDQLRLGNVVVVARLRKFCPVNMLQLYLTAAEQNVHPSHFLFRRVCLLAGVKSLVTGNEPMSYSNVRDVVRKKALTLGLEPSCFGTCSLRAGGSNAVADRGVGDRLFQRLGHWSSVAAKDGYIQDSIESRLSVTLALQ
jgi:hypothetical protein